MLGGMAAVAATDQHIDRPSAQPITFQAEHLRETGFMCGPFLCRAPLVESPVRGRPAICAARSEGSRQLHLSSQRPGRACKPVCKAFEVSRLRGKPHILWLTQHLASSKPCGRSRKRPSRRGDETPRAPNARRVATVSGSSAFRPVRWRARARAHPWLPGLDAPTHRPPVGSLVSPPERHRERPPRFLGSCAPGS